MCLNTKTLLFTYWEDILSYHTKEQCQIKIMALFNEVQDLKILMDKQSNTTVIKYHVDSLYQLTKELQQEYK